MGTDVRNIRASVGDLFSEIAWLLYWGGQAGFQPGRASLHLAEFDAPVSKDQPPFSSLLRLWLNRRLSAGLGIELVDFAS